MIQRMWQVLLISNVTNREIGENDLNNLHPEPSWSSDKQYNMVAVIMGTC